MAELIEPLGISLGDWLPEWDTMREDRDRGKMTVAQSFERTLRALGAEPGPDLLADLTRRDAEFSRAYVRLCDDTVPFLTWLRSRGIRIALVSNCADTTRAMLEYLGIIPLVDAVVLSCEVGSVKPYPENHSLIVGVRSGSSRCRVQMTRAPGRSIAGRYAMVRRMSSSLMFPNTPHTSARSTGTTGA